MLVSRVLLIMCLRKYIKYRLQFEFDIGLESPSRQKSRGSIFLSITQKSNLFTSKLIKLVMFFKLLKRCRVRSIVVFFFISRYLFELRLEYDWSKFPNKLQIILIFIF